MNTALLLVPFEFVASAAPHLLIIIILSESRGWEPFTSNNEDEYPEEGLYRDFFIIQMDKSTCRSNNRGVAIFGYPGKQTIDVTPFAEFM